MPPPNAAKLRSRLLPSAVLQYFRLAHKELADAYASKTGLSVLDFTYLENKALLGTQNIYKAQALPQRRATPDTGPRAHYEIC